jgi:predicted component of type VI protein secretion system
MKLVIEDEAGTRSIVPFTGDAVVVGRGADGVTFRLAVRRVSRRHARFVRQNGSVFVEDLGSLTGTRVNGERIAGRRKLRDGDLVQIGDCDLAVLAEGVSMDPAAPPPLPPALGPDPRAPAANLPAALDPTPAEPCPAPPPASASPLPAGGRARPRTLRLAVATGIIALAIGLAAGWAAGALTWPPAASQITRP